MPAAYLQFESITKTFPGVRALDKVSFAVSEGSIHGLVGENGAGKSTLLKILSGVHSPTSGQLRLAGRTRRFTSTAHAIRAGVAVIYQELNLVPQLSVAENLFLGHMPSKAGFLQRKALRRQTEEHLRRMGERIDPDEKVGHLPIAQRQMVEIAKALTRGAKVIAFDEPTSSLSAREVDRLFAIVRRLRDQGAVILYISHRLEEVFRLCDSVTVLRDGRRIETFPTLDGIDADTLVNRMVGRDIADVFDFTPRPMGSPVLEVIDVLGPGLAEPVSLTVAQGEIVGLFGLVGAGRTELCKLIYGAATKTGGAVRLHGRKLLIRSPRDAIRSGLMFCPEDRKREGVIAIRSVLENINLSARRHTAWGGFVLRSAWERDNARRQVERLAIRTPSLHQTIAHLSGGNQQKVILARWLSEQPKVLLLDEPTRGIDVGAKSEIYRLMYELASQGLGILMVSSELPEVLGATDRVLVMRQGRLVGEVPRHVADVEKVLRMALPAAENGEGSARS